MSSHNDDFEVGNVGVLEEQIQESKRWPKPGGTDRLRAQRPVACTQKHTSKTAVIIAKKKIERTRGKSVISQ